MDVAIRKTVHAKMLWVIYLEVANTNKDKIQSFTTEKATEYHGYKRVGIFEAMNRE